MTRFEPFHGLGLAVRLVIVADEMQKAMHRQMGEMIAERLALSVGLARRGLVGDHDVAEDARADRGCGSGAGKRQHVGRLVLAAPERG